MSKQGKSFLRHIIPTRYYSDDGRIVGKYIYAREYFPFYLEICEDVKFNAKNKTSIIGPKPVARYFRDIHTHESTIIRFTPQHETGLTQATRACINLSMQHKKNVVMNFRNIEIAVPYSEKTDDLMFQNIINKYFEDYRKIKNGKLTVSLYREH